MWESRSSPVLLETPVHKSRGFVVYGKCNFIRI
jgi:hypothetical protein